VPGLPVIEVMSDSSKAITSGIVSLAKSCFC